MRFEPGRCNHAGIFNGERTLKIQRIAPGSPVWGIGLERITLSSKLKPNLNSRIRKIVGLTGGTIEYGQLIMNVVVI